MNGKIVVVAAPSGAGKNTFINQAVKELHQLHDVITCTTRGKRKGEKEGDPYHFFSESEFKDKIKEEFFVEWAQVHIYYYGTPWKEILSPWSQGQAVIMDVDVQGAQTLREKFPQCLSIFIQPPNLDSLKERILKREGCLPDDIEVRMISAKKEIARAHEFDVQIINESFEVAFAQFKRVLKDYIEGA